MVRPKRLRHITSPPIIKGFRPEGIEADGEIILSLEEYEAIRLIDYDGLDQSQAAAIMNISRQTFGRILKTARFTLSKAVVEGKYLKVEGGCYTIRPNGPGHGRRGRGEMRRGGGQNMDAARTLQGDNQMNKQNEGQKNGQGQSGSQGRNKGQRDGTGQGRGKGCGQGMGQGKNRGSGQKSR